MRTSLLLFALVPVLAACSSGGDDDDHNAAAAVAAGFRPPTVLNRSDFFDDLGRRFTRIDADKDGLLAPSEIPPRFRDRVMALDADKNGKVSRAEFTDGALARFDQADANGDRALTSDERAAAKLSREGEMTDGNDDMNEMEAANSVAPESTTPDGNQQ